MLRRVNELVEPRLRGRGGAWVARRIETEIPYGAAGPSRSSAPYPRRWWARSGGGGSLGSSRTETYSLPAIGRSGPSTFSPRPPPTGDRRTSSRCPVSSPAPTTSWHAGSRRGGSLARRAARLLDRVRDPEHPRCVESEDLRLALHRQLRIAEALLVLGGDLERTEGRDLILRRAVPDAVGAPHDVVLADGDQQLAEQMRGLVEVPHHAAPRRAELGVHVAARPDTCRLQRCDQAVGAATVRIRLDLAIRVLVAGVVDDERDVRVVGGGRADVDR